MKFLLSALLLAVSALAFSSCALDGSRSALANPNPEPWAPGSPTDSHAGEILDGAPQPPRR